MRKDFIVTIIAIVLMVAIVGSVYAQVAVKNNGVQFGVAGALNQNNGINWSSDGFTLTINGVNWQNVNGLQVSAINWVGANITPSSGINWEQLRVSNGNTSSSLNWQAFGV